MYVIKKLQSTEKKLTELKVETDNSTVVSGNCSLSNWYNNENLSSRAYVPTLQNGKDTEDLNKIISNSDLMGTDRTLYQWTKE